MHPLSFAHNPFELVKSVSCNKRAFDNMERRTNEYLRALKIKNLQQDNKLKTLQVHELESRLLNHAYNNPHPEQALWYVEGYSTSR